LSGHHGLFDVSTHRLQKLHALGFFLFLVNSNKRVCGHHDLVFAHRLGLHHRNGLIRVLRVLGIHDAGHSQERFRAVYVHHQLRFNAQYVGGEHRNITLTGL